MLTLTRINHIGLRVSNYEITKAFYSRLGFEHISGPSGPEPVAIMIHSSGININFILNAQGKEKHNILMEEAVKLTGYTHVALEVGDIQQTKETLVKLSIPLSGETLSHPTGDSVFIRDPDDNVIEFLAPK